MIWLVGLLLLLTSCEEIKNDSTGENEYRLALTAQTIAERKDRLNKALQQLLSEPKNSATYRNISNAFYLLEEPALGLYYLYKSLLLTPRDKNLKKQIGSLKKELDLVETEKENPFAPLIWWHQILSVGEKMQLFLMALLGLFVSLSFQIWNEKKWIWGGVIFFSLIAFLLAGSLIYTRYIGSLEGVLIKPAALYREPSKEALLVSENPLPAGLKLEVLDQRNDGKWLKIKTDTDYGYVYYTAIRLL